MKYKYGGRTFYSKKEFIDYLDHEYRFWCMRITMHGSGELTSSLYSVEMMIKFKMSFEEQLRLHS